MSTLPATRVFLGYLELLHRRSLAGTNAAQGGQGPRTGTSGSQDGALRRVNHGSIEHAAKLLVEPGGAAARPRGCHRGRDGSKQHHCPNGHLFAPKQELKTEDCKACTKTGQKLLTHHAAGDTRECTVFESARGPSGKHPHCSCPTRMSVYKKPHTSGTRRSKTVHTRIVLPQIYTCQLLPMAGSRVLESPPRRTKASPRAVRPTARGGRCNWTLPSGACKRQHGKLLAKQGLLNNLELKPRVLEDARIHSGKVEDAFGPVLHHQLQHASRLHTGLESATRRGDCTVTGCCAPRQSTASV